MSSATNSRGLSWSCYRLASAGIRRIGLWKLPVISRLWSAFYYFVSSLVATRLIAGGAQDPFVIGGHRMYFGRDDRGVPPLSMLLGAYERGTTTLFERLLEPGMNVIDAGAHVGYFTLLAARRVGSGGHVYALEPDPVNSANLTRNVALNGYRNVTVLQKAVGNRTGRAELFVSTKDSMTHSLYRDRWLSGQTAPVETTTLDDFLAGEGFPRIDVVKMDIEGAEPHALEGMRRLFAKGEPRDLIVEFNPGRLRAAGTTPQEFLDQLAAAGFRVALISDSSSAAVEWPRVMAKLGDEYSVNLWCQTARARQVTGMRR